MCNNSKSMKNKKSKKTQQSVTQNDVSLTMHNECYDWISQLMTPNLRRGSRLGIFKNIQIKAVQDFEDPYPTALDYDLLSFTFMHLLNLHVYPRLQKGGKARFTLSYQMVNKEVVVDRNDYKKESFFFTLSTAVWLTDNSREGNPLYPKEEIFAKIAGQVLAIGENYDTSGIILAICVTTYCDSPLSDLVKKIPEEESLLELCDIYVKYTSGDFGCPKPEAVKKDPEKDNNNRFPRYITRDKTKSKKKTLFMVADLETIPIPMGGGMSIHTPYACGYMLVDTDKRGLEADNIAVFYSEDYLIIEEEFEKRSSMILSKMMRRMEREAGKAGKTLVIYFHNLGRFDGIILLNYLATKERDVYEVKPIIRNGNIYRISVYKKTRGGKLRLIWKFQDSFHLFPQSLANLGDCLCPELGGKIDLDHKKVSLDTIAENKDEYIDYMKQDIRLLGGVMRKALEIYWELYEIDILSQLTISSLSMRILRRKYYDDSDRTRRIGILSDTQDKFIRRGYYGGHTDVYKPFGKNLHYYDVNSLYPSTMKMDMPVGLPEWTGNIDEYLSEKKKKFDDLFGFIEAYIISPENMDKPFLPYKKRDGTLLFPTGRFRGVYFTEELRFAKSIGYTVIPIEGYVFKKKESPLIHFVNELYKKRLEAKGRGDKAMAYIYKNIMNSAYGRLGISPESTTTEVLDSDKALKKALEVAGLISNEQLGSDKSVSVLHYKNMRVTYFLDQGGIKKPYNAAVQISAAVTAYGRIVMYPYISRDDCYYTDTDSIVLKNELPKEMVSADEIGKFKKEHYVKEGIFLAPKSYCIHALHEDKEEIIMKHKGPVRKVITKDYYINQLADPTLKQQFSCSADFHRDFSNLCVEKKRNTYVVGIGNSTKRELVYDEDGTWKELNLLI